MGFFDSYNIATSGMSAQRKRIEVVSGNIANAQTTHTDTGGPYKKQKVVFEELLLNNVNNVNKNSLKGGNNDFSSHTSQNSLSNVRGVGVKEIVDSQSKPMMKHEPDHPDANKDGYVAYPNINPVIEMVDLIEAMRSYEANLAAFK